MTRQKTPRKILNAACLAAATLAVSMQPGVAAGTKDTALPAAPLARVSHIDADFTIFVGGLLFIQGNFTASLGEHGYSVKTDMGTAGAARTFYPAEYKLTSKGRLKDARIRPAQYVSDTWSRHSTRKVTMAYDDAGMPVITSEPPYEPDDLDDVLPSQQMNTQDPVSAFVMPVEEGKNPCNRSIAVFDGRRRYDLRLAYEGEKKMTPPGQTQSIMTVVCTIKYVPIAPVEKRKFTNMLRRNDDMKVWLAPFDGGRVYLPVRFQLRTPLGGAVMELNHVKERVAVKDVMLHQPQ